MGTSNDSDEFKRDAVQQIRVRGYPVREVSQRLGVSSHSLYKWLGQFAEPAPKLGSIDHEAENRRLKRELDRASEERDILKTVTGRKAPVRDINSLWYPRWPEGQVPMAYLRVKPRQTRRHMA